MELLIEAIQQDNVFFIPDNDRPADWVETHVSQQYERILLTNIEVKPKHELDQYGRLTCEICGTKLMPKSLSCHRKTRIHLAFQKANDKFQTLVLS